MKKKIKIQKKLTINFLHEYLLKYGFNTLIYKYCRPPPSPPQFFFISDNLKKMSFSLKFITSYTKASIIYWLAVKIIPMW